MTSAVVLYKLSQMLFALVSFLALSDAYPQSTLDPILVDIFGTPPTSARPANLPPRLEDITIKPTTGSSSYLNAAGEPCQCVPYYLCNQDLKAVFKNNETVFGWGVLDVRFGENDCQESVERCCTSVDPEPVVPERKLKACGYRNREGLDFQVTGGNGNEAQFGEFPWVVAVLAPNGTYFGVGVLIHPQVVLTGAHIVSKFNPGNLVARAGEWDTQTNKERLKSQERVVNDIVVRDDFGPKTLRNDMALLHLQTPFELNQHINVLCLPDQDEQFDQYKGCVANGWGKNKFGKRRSYAVILKKVEIDMVPFGVCEDLLKKTRLGPFFELDKSFVCAGGEEGVDTCEGDGGAPLACPIGDDRYKLSGLVAWGIGCGAKNVPAAYARVAMFRNWIDDVMISWGYTSEGYTVF